MNNVPSEIDDIQQHIYLLRGFQDMLDEDLATLYGVETRVLNQAVKRNIERFPPEFMFQVSAQEFEILKSQFVTSRDGSLRSQNVTLKTGRGQHRKYLPYAFTEQGVAMLSAVLKYEPIILKDFSDSHDRFLIIDETELYHIGASLKDLGKKWFAFSKMDIRMVNILEPLKHANLV